MTSKQDVDDLYRMAMEFLETCERFAIKAAEPSGNEEILAVVREVSDAFASLWHPFRERRGIPDHSDGYRPTGSPTEEGV